MRVRRTLLSVGLYGFTCGALAGAAGVLVLQDHARNVDGANAKCDHHKAKRCKANELPKHRVNRGGEGRLNEGITLGFSVRNCVSLCRLLENGSLGHERAKGAHYSGARKAHGHAADHLGNAKADTWLGDDQSKEERKQAAGCDARNFQPDFHVRPRLLGGGRNRQLTDRSAWSKRAGISAFPKKPHDMAHAIPADGIDRILVPDERNDICRSCSNNHH